MKWVLFLWLAACGTTGGDLVSFEVVAHGNREPIDNGLGWHVELTKANLHIGAVYLNLAVPISGSQETNCILPGIYTAEELASLDVDALSDEPQAFPMPATGTDDDARTAEVWLTGGDINAASDPTVIAELAGVATNGVSIPFTARVTIGTANRGIAQSDASLPSAHPICKQRIVSPIPISISPTDGGTLAIAIDPRAWFANVDFAKVPADGVVPDDNDNDASDSLFTGLRAGAFSFSFQPKE